MYDLIVIGAGVSGLMAAGTAASEGLSVLLLEKMERTGRKLRITGKGRCNITNNSSMDVFRAKIRSGAEFASHALGEWSTKDTMDFFEHIGVPLVVERGGRVFPTSGKATDVADAMERWARKSGVDIRCNSAVDKITIEDGCAKGVATKNGQQFEARAVLIATGGVSYPRTGSTGDGHQMAYDTGHEIAPLSPALVPLSPREDLSALAGTELRNVEVFLSVDGCEVESLFGEVTFYAESIAGATVLTLSRKAVDAIASESRVALRLDLKPALSTEKLTARINREVPAITSAPIGVLLDRLVPRPLHPVLLVRAGINRKYTVGRLTPSQVDDLVYALKNLRFEIADYRPFSEAIVTAGGVSLNDVDPLTMRSRIVEGLYFAGELLDIDADTGGYNIQLALSTARLAAQTIKKSF